MALGRHGIESQLIAGDATAAGIEVAREHGLEPECLHRRVCGLQWTPSREFAEWLGPRFAGADLVHAHMFGAWWAAARAAPAGTPLVASEHNQHLWPGRPRTAKMREALRRIDVFFAHGPSARATVVAHGLPLERVREGISPVMGTRARPAPASPVPASSSPAACIPTRAPTSSSRPWGCCAIRPRR